MQMFGSTIELQTFHFNSAKKIVFNLGNTLILWIHDMACQTLYALLDYTISIQWRFYGASLSSSVYEFGSFSIFGVLASFNITHRDLWNSGLWADNTELVGLIGDRFWKTLIDRISDHTD